MDFDFTQDQLMLRDLTREFLARESSPRTVRQLMDDRLGYSETMWRQMADMGLLGVAVEAGYGGLGLGSIEQALVLEEMGRAAVPSPYFATAVLVMSAIAASGDARVMARYLPDLAAGRTKATLALLEDALAWNAAAVQMRAQRSGDAFVLRGTKRCVPWAHVANLILVAVRTGDGPDGTSLLAVAADAEGLHQAPNVDMDRTSRTSTVTFDDVQVPGDALIGPLHGGWGVLGAVLERAAVASAAEMLGASRRCMDMSVEYAKVRQQFGQPIGTFQAIKHACAEMLLEVENSHAATYFAAWALAAGSPEASLAASSAKAYVGEAARKVCGSAIQVHGGIGFTWEYDLHLYFKRAKHNEPLYGDADFHRARALELMLERVTQPDVAPEPALAG